MLQATIEQGGYWLLFCITMIEGLPLVGSIVPGQTLIGIAGFLSHLGVFNIVYVLIVTLLGSILGDVFGYVLGKRYGYEALVKFGSYFFLKKEHIDRARALVARHTGKAIIVGRFSPITRSLMPFLVGTSGAKQRSFWIYDIIGCTLWVAVTLGVGYAFGASYVLVAKRLGTFVVIGVIGVILLIWAYEFINIRAHIFRRYELGTLCLTALGLAGFFVTLQDVVTAHSYLANLDVWVNGIMVRIAGSFVEVARVISALLSPYVFASLGAIFVMYLMINKRWTRVFLAVSSLGGGFLLVGIVKILVGRIRPENAFLLLNDFSFPSQHALMAAIFFYLCIFFFAKRIKTLLRRELYVVACCLLVVVCCVSRLSLNVHWFSDVIAGISLGIFWTGSMVLAMRVIDRGILRK